MLSETDFRQLIRHAPLVSVDLIVNNDQGHVLMGYRNNAPAKGYFFVPGGRIQKDESFETAVERISMNELGHSISFSRLDFVGFFEQFYAENYFEIVGLTTHYIALVFKNKIPWTLDLKKDEQHSQMKFMSIKSIDEDPFVHPNCKLYFRNK